MIRLANDPNASRMGVRAADAEAQRVHAAAQRSRSGHAWPFLSRNMDRPSQQAHQKPAAKDSGS